MKVALHWFRRDLRITDNTALHACHTQAEKVVPVYVLSDWRGDHRWTGSHRQQFLCGSLASLQQNLQAIGGHLIIRQGDAVDELCRLAQETGAEAIFFNRDPDPFGRATEQRLRDAAASLRLRLHDFKDVCIHERDEVLNGSGQPFRVFTPYARAWGKLPHPAPLGRLRSLHVPPGVKSLSLPTLSTWGLIVQGEIIEPGEKAARNRLGRFIRSHLSAYGARRDFPALAATSRLSQDLRYGLLSIREVFQCCVETMEALPATARNVAQKYLGELIWREFYMQVLWHHPQVLDDEFNPVFRGMPWPGKSEHFRRWRDGETGFPIVDAAMRELHQTGFMHNRARMIAAMFLTKDLHLDWRLGESWFMRLLTDGDIASNNGGWQWSAGVGADAAPYFRIQNPWSQTKRYDPDGAYIKRWIPELSHLPPEKFYAPPAEEKALVGGYPLPMIDHAHAREKTLQLFSRYKADGPARSV